eukprot:6678395-Pyramimonas_sp.AAC.1
MQSLDRVMDGGNERVLRNEVIVSAGVLEEARGYRFGRFGPEESADSESVIAVRWRALTGR